MKTPKRLEPLIRDGIADEVIRQLMSGKEATVYLVRSGNEVRCAKVYKDIEQRSFRNMTPYQEGRKVRNSRQQRAMEKGSKFGKQELENEWQNAEVAALYQLAAAGVRVPKPYGVFEGVMVMELVCDANGDVAPRLNDVELPPELAVQYHNLLVDQVVLMLCAGLVHGDLSEYNVLLAHDGPVIIDLPQAVNAAGNSSARMMLERDVRNMADYFGRFAPQLLSSEYGKEIWQHYEGGTLHAGMPLTGLHVRDKKSVDMRGLLREIDDARAAEARRLAALKDPEAG